MLVELRDDVWVEKRLLGTLGIPRIKVPDVAKPRVASQALAEVMELLDQLEIRIAPPALSREPLVIPRVFFPYLLLRQPHFRRIWIVRDLNTESILRL